MYLIHLYLIHLYLIHLYLIHLYLIHLYLIHLYLIHLYLIHLYISLSLNPSYFSFEPLVVNLSTYLARLNPHLTSFNTPFRRVAVQ